MKGAGGIGGEDGDIVKPLSSRPYPPGLQPGGEFCIRPISVLFLPHINYAWVHTRVNLDLKAVNCLLFRIANFCKLHIYQCFA